MEGGNPPLLKPPPAGPRRASGTKPVLATAGSAEEQGVADGIAVEQAGGPQGVGEDLEGTKLRSACDNCSLKKIKVRGDFQ